MRQISCTQSEIEKDRGNKENKRKGKKQQSVREGAIKWKERKDRRPLPLQGHKGRRHKEGQDNRRKTRGKRERRGTVRERTERAWG